MAILRAVLLPLAVLLLGLAMLLPRAAHSLAIGGTLLAFAEVVLVLLNA